MNLLKEIKSSVYDPEYYNKVLHKPLSAAFKYFFKFIALLALVCALLSIIFVPKLGRFADELGQKIISAYPAELQVTIKGGQASSNVTEPYFINMPQNVGKQPTTPLPTHLLTIDTKDEFNLTAFDQYDTSAVLSKNSIAFKDANGKITIQPLSKIPDVTINRDSISSWTTVLTAFVGKLSYVLPVFVFIGVFLAYLGKLVYLLIVSLLVLLLLKTRNLHASYGNAYKLGLHAITLPTLISLILIFAGLHSFFLLPTLIFFIVLIFNVKEYKSPESHA